MIKKIRIKKNVWNSLKLKISTLVITQIIVERIVHRRLELGLVEFAAIVVYRARRRHASFLLGQQSTSMSHLEEHVANDAGKYDAHVYVDFDARLKKYRQHRTSDETERLEQDGSRVGARIVRKEHAEDGAYLSGRQTIREAERSGHEKYDVDALRVVGRPRDHEYAMG